MKRCISLALTMFVMSAPAYAQSSAATVTQSTEPTTAMGESMSVEVEVVAIDLKERKVSLKDAEGVITEIAVGPEVKNLPQVKVGDLVRVRYSQSLTVSLKKGAGLRSKSETIDGTTAQAGQKPGAAARHKVHITADILDINPKTGLVKLKGPQGRTLELTVKDKSVLNGYQPGDQIEGTYQQVLSIGVVTPKAPK